MTAVWAHRGASAQEPENTVAAFAAAVALGADGIELDVRRTADGVPVVLHDPRLPDGRTVASVARRELPVHVPLLSEALDACGELVVNIEIKEPPDLAEVVVAEVRRRGMADRVVVSCFDVATVDRVRALDAGVPTAILTIASGPVTLPALVEQCRRDGHTALHPHHSAVDAELVARAHAVGVACNTWTVDDPARIAQLAALGVDAVVTNDVPVALAATGRGGGSRPARGGT